MQLPDRPNLRYLRDQAKNLGSIRLHPHPRRRAAANRWAIRFRSWSRLRAHVESRKKTGQLAQAIAANDVAPVDALVAATPELRQFLIDDDALRAVAQPGTR